MFLQWSIWILVISLCENVATQRNAMLRHEVDRQGEVFMGDERYEKQP